VLVNTLLVRGEFWSIGLGSRHSTTELRPRNFLFCNTIRPLHSFVNRQIRRLCGSLADLSSIILPKNWARN